MAADMLRMDAAQHADGDRHGGTEARVADRQGIHDSAQRTVACVDEEVVAIGTPPDVAEAENVPAVLVTSPPVLADNGGVDHMQRLPVNVAGQRARPGCPGRSDEAEDHETVVEQGHAARLRPSCSVPTLRARSRGTTMPVGGVGRRRRAGRLFRMARSTSPEKRPGFLSQIQTLFRFTREVYPWLGWLIAGVIVLGILIGVGVGFLIPPVAGWSVILWGVTGLMFGVLGSLMTMTRLSTRAMYQKIDGMPGASGHVLSTALGRNWQGGESPVGVNPRSQDAVFRAIGRGGVVIVAEGARGRLTRLVADEKSKIQRVASGVPVTVLYVGHGDEDVAISKLATTIKRLPKAIDRGTQAAVIKRLDSVSRGLSSLPIPKGVDPLKARAPRPR